MSPIKLVNLTAQLHNSIQYRVAVLPSNDGTQLTLSRAVIKMYEVPPIFLPRFSIPRSPCTITRTQPRAKHTMHFLIPYYSTAIVCVCVRVCARFAWELPCFITALLSEPEHCLTTHTGQEGSRSHGLNLTLTLTHTHVSIREREREMSERERGLQKRLYLYWIGLDSDNFGRIHSASRGRTDTSVQ